MMCTAYEEDEKVFLALEAGAHGYILKSASTTEILEAVTDLKNGGSPVSNQVARKVMQSFRKKTAPAQNQLTPRENEVLQFLSKGLLYKEIARQLSVSNETVRRHCFNIYEKLHVHNRTEALNKYFGSEKKTPASSPPQKGSQNIALAAYGIIMNCDKRYTHCVTLCPVSLWFNYLCSTGN